MKIIKFQIVNLRENNILIEGISVPFYKRGTPEKREKVERGRTNGGDRTWVYT